MVLYNYLVGFYTLLGFLLTVSHSFATYRDPKKIYLVLIYAIFSAFLAQTFLWKTGLIYTYPDLAYVNYPFSLLAGPLIERYFSIAIFGQASSVRKFILLSFAIFTAGFLALNFIIGEQPKIVLVQRVLSEGYAAGGRILVLLTFVFFAAFLSRLLYKFYAHFRIKTLFRSQPIRYLLLIVLAQIICIIAGLIYVYSINQGSVDARSVVVHAIGFLLCCTVVLEYAYPDIITDVKKEAEKESRYKNSQLASVNIQHLNSRLARLLETEKLYRDETLNHDRLASLLNLNRHQLSEYLSQHQEKTFFQLLNKHRIAESKKILLERPGETILSIAFAVGFQTKSVFNNAFKQETGMTPTEYRKNNRA